MNEQTNELKKIKSVQLRLKAFSVRLLSSNSGFASGRDLRLIKSATERQHYAGVLLCELKFRKKKIKI